MKKLYTLINAIFVLVIFFPLNISAQRTCAAHDHMLEQFAENPVMLQKSIELENFTRQYVATHSTLKAGETRTIPVYVHVIYRLSQENISDAQIASQITVLNLDYGSTNPDFTMIPAEFTGVSSPGTGIQYVLAGVDRKYVNRTAWGTNDAMKMPSQNGVAPITPETHLNIWVCNIGGGILGYAQFPGGNWATDGVVISPQYFGSSTYNDGSFYLSVPFDKGRTATHEIGHYLNLRHIWGDGPCANDYVDDTPTSQAPYYGCPSYPQVSCGGSNMFMNYMDYVDDPCMYMFSQGQEARMWACLNSSRINLGATGGNPAPVANANGPYNSTVNTSISFSSAGSSDSNGTIASYSWSFGDGATSALANPTHAYTAAGTYTVSLTVTDNEGATGTNTTTATITAGSTNLPPIVNVNGPYTGVAGTAISFSSAGSSDPDGTIVSGLWNFGDGSTVANVTNPTHTYTSAGTYTVVLSITDNRGATSTASTTATVSGGTPTNQPPVANANGPYAALVGVAINFSSVGTSDPDGTIVSGLWNFGDGTTITNVANPTHAYTNPGTYTVVLSVTDNRGATSTSSTTATITTNNPVNNPPVAFSNGPYSGSINNSISFSSAGSTDNDGTIVNYLWNFGDGSTSSSANPSHTFATEGTYSVSLTVTDDDGATDVDQTTATISSGSGGQTTVLLEGYFETGWDGWSDGGVDVERYNGSFSYEGSYSLNLQDNSGGASATLSQIRDVRNYDQISIDFYFYANSMENGEDFFVGYYDGVAWRNIRSYVSGTNFVNGSFYHGNVVINKTDYAFPANARFAFQCDASDNDDDIYIDAVVISGITGTGKLAENTIEKLNDYSDFKMANNQKAKLSIYPNPVREILNIGFAEIESSKVEIYSLKGSLMKSVYLNYDNSNIDVSDLNSGVYIIKLTNNSETIYKRFVKE
ncbi:MAG: PKD domain-containing protein [Bacteroidales bacterium]